MNPFWCFQVVFLLLLKKSEKINSLNNILIVKISVFSFLKVYKINKSIKKKINHPLYQEKNTPYLKTQIFSFIFFSSNN